MKKRFLSILLVLVVVLSCSFSAFAESMIPDEGSALQWYFQNQMLGVQKGTGVTLVCPNGDYKTLYTGGTLVTCPYDGEALVLADAGGVTVKKIPDGIGRKDLGYLDNKGTPYIGSSGVLYIAMEHDFIGFYGYNQNSYYCNHHIYTPSSSATLSPTYICRDDYMAMRVSSSSEKIYPDLEAGYKLVAPIDGYYSVFSCPQYSSICNSTSGSEFKNSGEFYLPLSNNLYSKGTNIKLSNKYSTHAKSGRNYYSSTLFYASISGYAILQVKPLVPDYKQQTNITINNNTWNGNIYTNNSTNLTYIYPQYTTINESGDTVTNISENPIIYNSETKQYYTYDTVTNNYYYITYEQQPATPTPSPSPTPDPGSDPTPTPTPGGGTIITPGGGDSGSGGSTSTPESGNKGDSGSSGWNPFKWLTDLLKDLVESILKGIWKLITSIFGFILWLLSLLFKLFPWLPNSGILALCAGVVVVTVIRIIKFITGR